MADTEKTETATEPPTTADATGDAAIKAEGETQLQQESTAVFEPVVQLDEVEVTTGEEEEEVLYKQRAKLFRFGESLLDKGKGIKTWNERGIGEMRFLKHKTAGKIRMLMRQEKTMKIICNHLVNPDTKLEPNVGSDRSWVWTAYDFSEGELEDAVFAIRFGNADIAKKYKEEYEKVQKDMRALEAGEDAADTAGGDAAAEALNSLSVKGENTDKDKAETPAE